MSGLSPMLRKMQIQTPRKVKEFKKELKKDFVLSNTDVYNVMVRSILSNPNICIYNHSIPIFTQYYYDKTDVNEIPVKFNEMVRKPDFKLFENKNLKHASFSKLGIKFKEFKRNFDRIWDNFLYFYEDCKASVIVLPMTLYLYDKDKKGKLEYIGTHNITVLIDKISKVCVYLDVPKDFPRKNKIVNYPVNYRTNYFKDVLYKLNVIQDDILGKVFPIKVIPLAVPSFVSTKRLHSFWTLFLTDLFLKNYGKEIEYGKVKTIDIVKTLNSLYEKYNEYRLSILLDQYIAYLLRVKENVIPKNKSFWEKLLD